MLRNYIHSKCSEVLIITIIITVCFKVELFGLTDEIGSVDGNDYIYAVILTN